MAYVLSDYCCNRSLPSYPVINDEWYVPNIWNDGDIGNRYDGWLYKPQYRIVRVDNNVIASFFVFDETEDRDFVGNYSSLEDAHNAGCEACGVQGY